MYDMPAFQKFIFSYNIQVIGIGDQGSLATQEIYKSGCGGMDFSAISTNVAIFENLDLKDKWLIEEDWADCFECYLRSGKLNQITSALPDCVLAPPGNSELFFVLVKPEIPANAMLAIQVASVLKQTGKVVITVIDMPLEFEGKNCMSLGNTCLEHFKKIADCVIVIDQKVHSEKTRPSMPQLLKKSRETMCAVVLMISCYASLDLEFFETYEDLEDIKNVLQNAHFGMARSTCASKKADLSQAGNMATQCLQDCLEALPNAKWGIMTVMAPEEMLSPRQFYTFQVRLKKEVVIPVPQLQIIYGFHRCVKSPSTLRINALLLEILP